MSSVAIIDYGGSNLRSVVQAIEHVASSNQSVIVTNQAAEIERADRVVFPGQGAIGDCMRLLTSQALIEPIKAAIKDRPFLGICLGLQSLLDISAEDGGTECLGCYSGEVKRFPDPVASDTAALPKIPHMGWNEVEWQSAHPLVAGIDNGTRFYFVHSYYVVPSDQSLIIGETEYITRFTSALAADNAFATQFHPEKSADQGLQLLENFLAWDGQR